MSAKLRKDAMAERMRELTLEAGLNARLLTLVVQGEQPACVTHLIDATTGLIAAEFSLYRPAGTAGGMVVCVYGGSIVARYLDDMAAHPDMAADHYYRSAVDKMLLARKAAFASEQIVGAA